MIVLDMNVMSELLKPQPDQRCVHWLDTVAQEKWTTSIAAGELLAGVALRPPGRRTRQLAAVVAATLDELLLRGAVLDYNFAAAAEFGQVKAARRAAGRPIQDADAMIAAICRAHNAPLATRNTKDFEGTGVKLHNPWA